MPGPTPGIVLIRFNWRDAMPQDDEVGTGSPQLSQQGLILYARILEDATFIKRQQWAVTNYAA